MMSSAQTSAQVVETPQTTPSHELPAAASSARKVFPEDKLPKFSPFQQSKARAPFCQAIVYLACTPWNLLLLPALKSVTSTFSHLKDIASSDKRKVVHPLKVGLALAITSLYVMLIHDQDFIGRNGIWAIMTVVVIFEFSAGATYCKGLNRAIGTFLASVLVLGFSQLAMLGGLNAQLVTISIIIFLVGAVATFLRLVPKIKANYDYGVLIFLLTFSFLMITTSSHLDPLDVACSRLYMVAVGASIALATSTFIFPIWAGDELHSSISNNFQKLAKSLEGSIHQYFHGTMPQPAVASDDEDPIYKTYRTILSSSSSEESLANFATWEPPHGDFMAVRYPWRQYLRIGKALRHCAYTTMALHGCLSSEVQAPMKLRTVFQEKVEEVSKQAGNVLRNVGSNLKNMQRNLAAAEMLDNLKNAAEELQKFIDSHSGMFITFNMWSSSSTQCSAKRLASEYDILYVKKPRPWTGCGAAEDAKVPHSAPLLAVLPHQTLLSHESSQSANNFSFATLASLLIETVARIEQLVEAVDQLAIVAKFKQASQELQKSGPHIIIDIDTRP